MTVRYCDYCGKDIPLRAKVCPYCKKILSNEGVTAEDVFSAGNALKNEHKEGFNATELRSPVRTFGEPTKKLDISKYIDDDSENQRSSYFDTNIYSFSENEIEKRFERKPERYYEEPEREYQGTEIDEEELERRRAERRAQRNNRKGNKRGTKGKKKNNLPLIIAALAAVVLIVVLVIVIANPFGSNDTSLEDFNSAKPTTTAITTATTETTTEETTVTTTEPHTIGANTLDLDGYLGCSFSSIEADFGTQTASPQADDYYGGNKYFYDGMTISTSENGGILALSIDFATVNNKDAYRYQEITYYSIYGDVLEKMGEPDLDQMSDQTEPCVGYYLSEGTTQFLKIKFDENKKVSGFEFFYSDDDTTSAQN